MLSERSIINGLILIAGMVLGPYLITLTFELNQIAILAFTSLVFIFIVFFFVKDRISAFPVLAGYFGGNLNFLPFGLALPEVFCLMLILYYFINYVMLKRRPIDGGPRYFLFPMLVVFAIVLYHNHKLSLGALGGAEEGSRPGIMIMLACISYLCGINIPTLSPVFLSRLPWWCFAWVCAGSAPYVLTTYIPSLAPYVFYVSGNVNLGAYVESIKGGDLEDVGRNGALLGIGGTLQGILVCYYPINTWWRPTRWILVLLSLACLYGILISGYRNALFSFLLTILLATACYIRWRILILLPIMALAPLSVMLVQNNHIGGLEVPMTVQRTLSFLPGNWDQDVAFSASNSNDFRADITRVYKAEYMHKSPWIGNGFSFDPRESEAYEAQAHSSNSDPAYYETKAFLTSKNFHVGWISLYDAVGIIGSVAFVILCINMIGLTAYFVFRQGADLRSPLYPIKVWFFCNLTVGFIGYFTTFGSFNGTFIGLCADAVILVCLSRIENRDALNIVSPSPQVSLGANNRPGVLSPANMPLR